MKFIQYIILLTFSFSCGNKKSQQAQVINTDSTVGFITNKLTTYKIGFAYLKLVSKNDSIDVALGLKSNVRFKKFKANSSHNKLDFDFYVEFYSANNNTIKEVNKKLHYFHSMELKKLKTEKLIKLRNTIVIISVSKNFDNSYLYLNNIAYRLLTDYVNMPSQPKK